MRDECLLDAADMNRGNGIEQWLHPPTEATTAFDFGIVFESHGWAVLMMFTMFTAAKYGVRTV